MTYEERIMELMMSDTSIGWTTQEITETISGCKKGDLRYQHYVEVVTKDMQRLKKSGRIVGERTDTGKGWWINIWKVNKMKRYVGTRHYKPANWDRWEWSDFISELRGDCAFGEGIETGADDEGNEYYQRYVREDE